MPFSLKTKSMLVIISVLMSILAACSPEGHSSVDSATLESEPLAPLRVTLEGEAGAGTEVPGSTATPGPTMLPQLDGTEEPVVAVTMGARIQYDVRAVLDWPTRTVTVAQRVVYRNESGSALQEIVFNVDVNREPGDFDLRHIRLEDGSEVDGYLLEAGRLAVPLPSALASEDSIALALEFGLTVPPIHNGYRKGHLGYWGYSDRQVNLGMWFPLVAAFDPMTGWVSPRFHDIGEHFVLEAADFSVELEVDGASENVRVAGPGKVTRLADWRWRFELADAREIALSVSEHFRTLRDTTPSGVEVELFYLDGGGGATLNTPRHALDTAVNTVSLLEARFGSCGLARLAVVEGDFPDGMEFSGLVFVSEAWFRTWNGIPNDWLTIITAHEVAHQWWYAQVGNHQGMHPYLDEALAIYCEILYFEQYYPEFVEWWWDFRVHMYGPVGYVDTPVYDFESPRLYINAVYLRGALMMQALRTTMGDEAFFGWLKGYFDAMHGQIATPKDLWRLMPADAYALTEATRSQYLSQYQVLRQQPASLP